MTSIILLSSLVSLITLGILFIQRVSPERIKIPSFFLGVRNEQPLSHVKTKPPYWWEILALLLFTLGSGLAYYAQTQNTSAEKTQGQGIIWFDSSMSHVRTLRASKPAREYVTDALKDLRYSKYLFIELTYTADSNGLPQPSYELQSISASELEKYIQQKLNTPTALSQPLQASILLQSLDKDLAQNLNRNTLTLVTDGQSETLRPIAELNTSFESVRIIKTPTPTNGVTAATRRTPLVPEELALLWSFSNPNDVQSALPSTPQLVKLDAQLSARIPRQARPTLTLEEMDLVDSDNATTPTFAMISSQDVEGNESALSARGNQPLITTCTFSVAGPSELDGLSDLRAYAQFFSIPMRPLACRATESSLSARAADSSDPWKYRRSSIWVVPVNETVAGELFQQGLFWIPEGFAPESDALVYIADTRLAGVEGLMESVNVQLEINQPTIRLPLLPLPPSPLTFPWQIKGNGGRAIQAKPIALSDHSGAPMILKAADGTPMAYTLSEKPSVVYLRTGGAATNGELGRWGKWAGLWTGLTQRLKNTSPTLSNIRLNTPQDWSQWFAEQKQLQLPKLRYIIDGQNLKAQLIQNPLALLPAPALYIRERDDQMVLVEPPASERLSEIMSSAEIEQLFPARNQVVQRAGNEPSRASALQWLGALLAAIAVLVLWIVQHQKQRDRISARSAALLVLASAFSTFVSTPGWAQSLRSQPQDSRVLRAMENKPQVTSHPFRVGWCDANIPDSVQQRYRYLQNLLASRGTIELPRQLTAGACRLGAAEIWWTSSLEALQAAPVAQHIRSGGVVIAEGIQLTQTPEWMLNSADQSIGLAWESPKRRGLLYRSFYLLSSFDGCTPERTLILTLRKKVNAQAPMGLVTPVRFLTATSEGADCFLGDDDGRSRSFVNLMYALLTTDYKEDQMQLPEILNRVRNLGLEP